MEVFKLQRSVPLGKVLVYNKDRKYYGEVPYSKDLGKYFGENSKVYVNGEITESGILNIIEVVDTPHPYW